MNKAYNIYDNGKGSGEKTTPLMSIVTPIYKNDPSPLLDALIKEIGNSNTDLSIEFFAFDDGSQNIQISNIIKDKISQFGCTAVFIEYLENNGRSFARNKLLEASNGKFVLFLDSDMLPDGPNFIHDWLQLCKIGKTQIAYGGFTTKQASKDKKYALANALANKTDCLCANDRKPRGAMAVATSNLLVQSEILRKIPFDDGFKGWGWEDVDWALRAQNANFIIDHVEIPATHLGLDEDIILLDKLKKAGPNFKHIMQRHSEISTLSTGKMAIFLAKLPLLEFFSRFVQIVALSKIMPIKIRSFCTRLYRALWAAISLKS